MRDKLYKNYHKATYYRFKKLGVCFISLFAFIVVAAIPLSIAVANGAKAQTDTNSEVVDTVSSSEDHVSANILNVIC